MTPFPTSPEELTPAWLSTALGREVTSATCTPVGTGLIGSCFSIALEGDDAPDRLFVKFPAVDVAARDLLSGAYRSELLFYRDLAETVAIRTPRRVFAEIADSGTEFVLILEDLHPAVQGDQLAGCGLAQARDAVINLAGLHGPRWCDPTLPDWLHRNGPDDAAVLAEVYVGAMDTFVERFSGQLAEADVDVLRGLPLDVVEWILAREHRYGVVHGDYRLDNLVFPPGEEPGVAAVDWQTLSVGLPARDLAFFIGTSLEPELRRAHERELVAAYHQALVGFGVTDYTLEECWEDYVFALPQGPLITVLGCVFGARTERGDKMFLTMTERSCAAIRDHAN
jgi:hypothetical protein